MKARKVQLPQMSLRANVAPETINKEKRSVEIVWTTGAKGLRHTWDGSYFEELSLGQEHVRMERLSSGTSPLLNSHGQYELADVIGVVESAWLTETEGRAIVRFSDRPEVEGIWRDVENGILRNISVGYKVHKYERQPETEGEEAPTYRAIDWEPVELSVVPVGFDKDARIRAQESGGAPCEFVNNIPDNQMEVREMKKTMEGQAQVEAPAIDTENLKREAIAAERKRVSEIQSACRAAGMAEEFSSGLCESEVSIDEARAQIIAELAKRDQKTETRAQIRVEAGAQDEKATMARGMENALLHRSAPGNNELSDLGREYRGMSLLRMSEEVLGRSARGLSRTEVAQRAIATTDLANILANVAGKTLRDAYKVVPQTFWGFVQEGSLADYKDASRVQLGDAPNLAVIAEGGAYTEGTFGDGAEKISVKKFGKMLIINDVVIVNDDLNALTRLPKMLGAAASRLESKLVYDCLTASHLMADTKELFHADHGNLGTAAAVNETSLSAMRKALRAQKTLNGADNLDLSPAFLIVGPDKEVEAQKMLAALVAVGKTTDVNVFSNSMKLIVENRITGNQWFSAADKNAIDTIELAFLDGMRGPQISSEVDFDTDSVKIKIRHVVGAKAIDHRGLYKNPGV